MPAEHLMSFARESTEAQDADLRAVSKALIDVTNEADIVLKQFAADGNVDLAPFFDFWFVDSVDAAKRLLESPDDNIRHLAECLISQEQAIVESKEDFLTETKRLGVKPEHK